MSPFPKLVDILLGGGTLLAHNDPKTLFDKRDEIWGSCQSSLRIGRPPI
jgi:hypothetical protein